MNTDAHAIVGGLLQMQQVISNASVQEGRTDACMIHPSRRIIETHLRTETTWFPNHHSSERESASDEASDGQESSGGMLFFVLGQEIIIEHINSDYHKYTQSSAH